MLIISISRCILKDPMGCKRSLCITFLDILCLAFSLLAVSPSSRLLKNLDRTPNETARECGASEFVNRHINMAQRPLETGEGGVAETLMQSRWGNEHRKSAELIPEVFKSGTSWSYWAIPQRQTWGTEAFPSPLGLREHSWCLLRDLRVRQTWVSIPHPDPSLNSRGTWGKLLKPLNFSLSCVSWE